MLFNSVAFAAFFLAVYSAYLLLSPFPRGFKYQNLLLLAASYFFYGFWDWRFCLLLAGTTTAQYLLGAAISKQQDQTRRRLFLILAVSLSLTILGIFKYFNFFTDSFAAMLSSVGLQVSHSTVHLVLPVGMSFYTFKEISYIVDIYRRKQAPAASIFDFGLYVAFFPQLVAGPIERAGEMLPQIAKPRRITARHVDVGLHLILWGFFKKVVIADNLAGVSNAVFDNYSQYQGIDVVLGILAYAFQIYCDFSGYTDVARGVASLFGFELPLNFKLPYFARNPSDFWQRWHVTLSGWLRDYLYISLGGNKVAQLRVYANLMITMLLGGLWHGAAWNFVAWGGYHGLLLCAYRRFSGSALRTSAWTAALSVAGMFALTLVGWVFFRSTSLDQVWTMLGSIGLSTSPETGSFAAKCALFILPLFAVQIAQHRSGNLLVMMRMPTIARVAWQGALLIVLVLLGARESSEFIYFQF